MKEEYLISGSKGLLILSPTSCRDAVFAEKEGKIYIIILESEGEKLIIIDLTPSVSNGLIRMNNEE